MKWRAPLQVAAVIGIVGLFPENAMADQGLRVHADSGNIAWMLISSALMLMMTAPGLALFYGGLVRKKNILSVMMQCVFLMGLMSVIWAVAGYSLAFGGAHPLMGNFDHVLLNGIVPDAAAPAESSASKMLFATFQGMFFIITPVLICGAFAERMKFSAMCLFLALWGILVYCPVVHWVWSDAGWLSSRNPEAIHPIMDFAGGTVIHLTSGITALICAVIVGKRLGYGHEPMPPHNLTYTCVGAALLWVGWFGLTAGSALSASPLAVNAFLATHLAASGGVVAWTTCEWIRNKRPSILGACTGGLVGLVCITPAAGFVQPMVGLLMGAIGGIVCYFSCMSLKKNHRLDDSLDVFGVHGIGGTLGTLLTALLANRSVAQMTNLPHGNAGVLQGNWWQLFDQCLGIAAIAIFTIFATFLLLKILDATLGLRVDQEQELQGLDLSEHNEEGYIFL